MMTLAMRMSSMMQTNPASDTGSEHGILTAQCPACTRETQVHRESARIGAEVLCIECSAILRVDGVDPLLFSEIEETDLI